MSPAERRALLVILGLIVAGHAVRAWWLAPGDAPGGVQLLRPAGEAALAAQRATVQRAARPLAPGERVDLNTASAAEIERLPRIGPGLARRIVEDRAAHGPFLSLAELDRVPGVGPTILRELGPWVVQGATSGGAEGPVARNPPLINLNRATEAELLRLPGIGPTKARAIVAYRQSRGPFASVEGLLQVPGVGPATLAGLAGLVRVD